MTILIVVKMEIRRFNLNNPFLFRGSCVSTSVQQGVSWWMVDLVDTHNVGHVIVYPRLDNNSEAYLDGAVVGFLVKGWKGIRTSAIIIVVTRCITTKN